MSSEFIDALSRELSTAGIHGRHRDRILAEFSDHLSCDPNAQLGSPAKLARQFADELGTARTRRSAGATFGALALSGVLVALAFALANLGPLKSSENHPLAGLAGGVLAIAAQVAFATGLLAALRAFWRRHAESLPKAEATVIVRRAAIALASGLVSMVALAVMALALGHTESSSWRTYTVIAAAAGFVALLAVSPSVLAAARLRPSGAGERGDVLDDLGPVVPAMLRGRPWRFALLVAAALFAAVALQGVIVSDPFDGLFRAAAEAVACLIGFAALGPYVGLWMPASA